MCIKMMYNHINLRMYSNINLQSSTMQNHNYFCTNLTVKKFTAIVLTCLPFSFSLSLG